MMKEIRDDTHNTGQTQGLRHETQELKLLGLKSWVLSLKSNLGLRGHILINLTILMLSALFLMGTLGIKLMEIYIVKQKVGEARSFLPLVLSLFARRGDVVDMDSVITPIMKEKGVEGFVIVDRERKVLLQKGDAILEGPLYNSDFLRVVEMGEEMIEVIGDSWFGMGDKLRYTGQLKNKGSIYGGISILLTMEDVKRDLSYARRIIILYAFIYSTIFVIFGFFLLKRTVVNPIKKLEESAKRIVQGNLDERIVIERDDEIGSLTRSFNKMTESLVEKIKAIEKTNRELIETQDQMLRVERMASLGRIASSVAHEIGNPLGAISGYIDILLGGVDDEKEERDILERIQEEIKRVKEIIRKTLDLSRPSPIELKDVDVNEVICRAIELLKGSLKGIDVNLNLDREISLVEADPSQLEQVLINLILNARDSMPSFGKLSISTEEEDKSDIFLQRRITDPPQLDFTGERGLPPTFKPIHKWVKIVITDTGCGMDEATLKQIFTPFFSTKEPGKGTGLGLSISLGIIQSFGGDIRVRSEVGKGSTFEVILPSAGVGKH